MRPDLSSAKLLWPFQRAVLLAAAVALLASFILAPVELATGVTLGVRLARLDLPAGTIESTTMEEAPPTYHVWLGKRKRWLKGWMKIYIFHMRRPVRLLRELGWWQFFGFQASMCWR